MDSGRVKTILPVAAGLIAGALASLAVSKAGTAARAEVHETDLSPRITGQSVEPHTATAPTKPDVRIGDLERRIAELEAATAAPAEAPPPSGDDPTPESPEEQRAAVERAFTQALEAHRQEPLDPTWARSTAQAFQDDLASFPRESEITVLDVQCRSSTCTASFEWPTYEKARSTFSSVLHKSYQANCTRNIMLPEPAEPEKAYRATAIFDCSAWKTGLAQ